MGGVPDNQLSENSPTFNILSEMKQKRNCLKKKCDFIFNVDVLFITIIFLPPLPSGIIKVAIKSSVHAFLNPLSPKSDQHQISPANINALSNRVVMRITNMITQDEFT